MAVPAQPPIADLIAKLRDGSVSSAGLTEAALERARDPAGEGARVFTRLHETAARAEAEAADRRRDAGIDIGPLAGLPISIKDLFDVRGEPTPAGSVVLRDAPPAERDASVVARLRAAGAVIVGRTTMTEFAFSGLGINPHTGTPANPWDRPARRLPGGSSSGAAVSVTDGMAGAAIGSDTGGSVRIPSALCGLTGFKPTAARVPTDGTVPLSTTLDSIGPLAPTVACCALLDAVMAGVAPRTLAARSPRGQRFAVPRDYVMEGMDETVGQVFEGALRTLAAAGAIIEEIALPQLLEIPDMNARVSFPGAEAYAWHRRLLETRGDAYDPRVKGRILRAAEASAADYLDLVRARGDWIGRMEAALSGYDGLLFPTVPIVAPPIAPLEEDDATYGRVNLLLLRNPTVINFLDGCALSLPCHRRGEAPVGLMLAGTRGTDARILALGAGIEAALAAQRVG